MYINGEFVDDEIVRLEAARIGQRLLTESPAADDFTIQLRAREAAREVVIERILLRQAALTDPTPIPAPAIEAELEEYREKNGSQAGCLLPRDAEVHRQNVETELRVRRFAVALTANVPKPTGKQVAAFYQRAKQSFARPESVHAAHIVKNVDESNSESAAFAAIGRIKSLLAQGIPFEKVADENSDCPGRGGDLGVFARGEMVEEFDAVVFHLPAGSLSEIFRTPFGFHIAKVYERLPARIPALSEVRSQLEASMWQEMKIHTTRAFMQEMRARAEVRKSK